MNIERIRAALAAGPTPGPWSVETVPTSCGVCHKVGPFPGKRPDDPPRHACLYADYPSAGNPADDELMANANFIAACHPEAIRELLAERDALLEALQHMQHCASCAEDYWQNCEGGRAALAAIDAAKGRA